MVNTVRIQRLTFVLALAFCFLTPASLLAQARPIAIVGGTLIDGTGRAAVTDSVVVISGGRFQEVGKRGEVTIPQGAEMIDAKGKSILPGLIDGHCHYRDWMGEVYLAYGVVTCPNISNNPVDWIIAQREGVRSGSIRGPRVWASANIIDGPPPEGTGVLRRQRTSIIVETEDEARKAVRMLGGKGRRWHQIVRALETARRQRRRRTRRTSSGGRCSATRWTFLPRRMNGYQSVEHSWSVVYTSIQDPKKKARSRHRAHARQSSIRRRCMLRWSRRCSTRSSRSWWRKTFIGVPPGLRGFGRYRAMPPI